MELATVDVFVAGSRTTPEVDKVMPEDRSLSHDTFERVLPKTLHPVLGPL